LHERQPPSCAGRVALVTGASRGIGAAIARRLAAAVARSLHQAPEGVSGTLRETVAAIAAAGGRGVAIQGDILVNNATFGPHRPLETFGAGEIALTLEASVGAPLHLVQLMLPDTPTSHPAEAPVAAHAA
jgi:NAD(P)-dependent dehydrogenase (short-subunit alcohol dehydrogenase family)